MSYIFSYVLISCCLLYLALWINILFSIPYYLYRSVRVPSLGRVHEKVQECCIERIWSRCSSSKGNREWDWSIYGYAFLLKNICMRNFLISLWSNEEVKNLLHRFIIFFFFWQIMYLSFHLMNLLYFYRSGLPTRLPCTRGRPRQSEGDVWYDIMCFWLIPVGK